MIQEPVRYRQSEHDYPKPPSGSLAVALIVFPSESEISETAEPVYRNLLYFNEVDRGAFFAA
jgi:hypothetical protein